MSEDRFQGLFIGSGTSQQTACRSVDPTSVRAGSVCMHRMRRVHGCMKIVGMCVGSMC